MNEKRDAENRYREAMKFAGQFGETRRHSWNQNDCSFHCSDLLFSLLPWFIRQTLFTMPHFKWLWVSVMQKYKPLLCKTPDPVQGSLLCQSASLMENWSGDEFKGSKVPLLLFNALGFAIFQDLGIQRGRGNMYAEKLWKYFWTYYALRMTACREEC